MDTKHEYPVRVFNVVQKGTLELVLSYGQDWMIMCAMDLEEDSR